MVTGLAGSASVQFRRLSDSPVTAHIFKLPIFQHFHAVADTMSLSATSSRRPPLSLPNILRSLSSLSIGFLRRECVRSPLREPKHIISLSVRATLQPTRATSALLRFLRVCIHLLYVATSCLWWQAVAGRIGVTSSNPRRMNSRRTGRHREDSRNVHHTAIRRARSPLHPCGSVTADVHGCPRGGAPLRHPTASRHILVAAYGRSNDPSAAHAS